MNYIMRGSTMHDNMHDRLDELLKYCETARSREELQQYFDIPRFLYLEVNNKKRLNILKIKETQLSAFNQVLSCKLVPNVI